MDLFRTIKIIQSIEEGSSFFKHNDEIEDIPRFRRNEILSGESLGMGEFCIVKEIKQFLVEESCRTCPLHRSIQLALAKVEGKEIKIPESVNAGDLLPNVQRTNENRGFMKDHCYRMGSARYAMKVVNKNVSNENVIEAAIDLAIEAKFLAALSHTNIVKMRGNGGIPGHPDFFLILDRLYNNLDEKCSFWIKEIDQNRNFIWKRKETQRFLRLRFLDRLTACYDVARAMEYLHSKKIIHRDIKPENIGFDVRGVAKVFDFGLATELRPQYMVGYNEYKLSGSTGSRRYMAPEVALCKPYGLGVDVYSFSLVFWGTLALKAPFDGYSYEKHANLVVRRGKRPKIPKSWNIALREIISDSWSQDVKERPNFEKICSILKNELIALSGNELIDRTSHLLNRSCSSTRN